MGRLFVFIVRGSENFTPYGTVVFSLSGGMAEQKRILHCHDITPDPQDPGGETATMSQNVKRILSDFG